MPISEMQTFDTLQDPLESEPSLHAVCENVKADLKSLLTKYSSYAVQIEGMTECLAIDVHHVTACELLLLENIIEGFNLSDKLVNQ